MLRSMRITKSGRLEPYLEELSMWVTIEFFVKDYL
jgi:hypothetical protein